MQIAFATKSIGMAEKYIDNSNWEDLKKNKKRVLEAVKKGLIRICDPFMYGEVKISTGYKWYENHTADYSKFTDYVINELFKEE